MSTMVASMNDDGNNDLIKKLATLLKKLLQENNEKIGKYGIKDPNDLGAMYEQIINEILDKMLEFIKENGDNLEFNLTSGKLTHNADPRLLSKQIDSMIVYDNDGTKVSNNIYYYSLDNALITVESKKTMNKKEFEIAWENVFSIFDIMESYKRIKAKDLYDNYSEIDNEQFDNETTHEFYKPATVIYGFSSIWKNRTTLIKHFYKMVLKNSENMESNLLAKIPDLILMGDFAIIKLNGPIYFKYDSVKKVLPYFGISELNSEQKLYIIIVILLNKIARKYNIDIILKFLEEYKPDFEVDILLYLNFDSELRVDIAQDFTELFNKAKEELNAENSDNNLFNDDHLSENNGN